MNDDLSRKYHMVTYGCQMNEYDSGMIAEMLENQGVLSTDNIEDADYILVNTCSVREKAEDTALNKISQLSYLKKRRPSLQIAVLGCMAKNRSEEIAEKNPHVNHVLGPDNYEALEELFFGKEDHSGQEIITEFDQLENYFGRNAKLTNPYSTFIAIQRGCNKRCSYCIVPFVRGNEKDRPFDDIIREANEAVDRGVVEISLLGQTVNSYKHEGETFASLLMKLSEINGLERIRFTSPHPKHFSDDLIWVMGNRDNICKHTHLPVQSGSTSLLKKMLRQYTREKYLEIVEKLRKAHPDFAITTDIIAGFVGETEQDFEDTLSLVREVRFDNAFMFAYSPRKGTRSYKETETLTEAEKQARLSRLIEVQTQITKEQAEAMIGKDAAILVEGPSHRNPEEIVGKTDCFKKVVIPKPAGEDMVGKIVPVHINDIRGWTLRGVQR